MTALKHLLEACVSPIGIMTILLIAGLLVSGFRRQSRLGRRLILAGAGLYIIFVFTPLAEILMANLERPYPPMMHPDASSGIRTIVVLSGYGEDNPSFPVTSNVSSETLARMVEGIRLYRELPGAKLVLSGGVPRGDDKPVASLMADFGKAMGVEVRDIIVEGRSLTTYENLVEVQKIIGAAPFILVTSACDLPRAMAVARKLGMKPVAAPAGIWAVQHYPAGISWRQWGGKLVDSIAKPSTERLRYLQWANHEYLGYLWYWMRRRV